MSDREIFGADHIDESDQRLLKNKALLIAMSFFVVAFIILVMGYLSLKGDLTVKVELPYSDIRPEQSSLSVRFREATPAYFEVWGFKDVYEVANFKHELHSEVMTLFTKRMRPAVYGRYEKDINQIKDYIRINKLSQEFKPIAVHFTSNPKDVNSLNQIKFIPPKQKRADNNFYDEGAVIIKGIAKQTTGSTEIAPKECSYGIPYIILGGLTYATGFKSNCF